jgi:hypothetical protein
MHGLMKRAGIAALVLGWFPSAWAQEAPQICTPGDKIGLNFQKKPSMVVDDDTLDLTFTQAGLSNPHGADSERLFSFGRTIGALLDSAGATSTDAAEAMRLKEALVGTLIRSFDNNEGLLINPDSGVLVPVDDRFDNAGGGAVGEGALKPSVLLTDQRQALDGDGNQVLDEEGNPVLVGMKPLALFNRFDLAPADWRNCGEYRIVYALPDAGFQKRFLMIFEASLPNPGFIEGNPDGSAAGCRPIAEFWATLSSDPSKKIENAKNLYEIYYTGRAGVTAKTSPENPSDLKPIVSFRNYGGDGGRGQVRANIFFDGGWQLREWLTQLNVSSRGSALAFVPETVKDNPIAELYLDDISGTKLAQSNIAASVNGLHRDFIEHFATVVQDSLFVERSKKYREQAKEIASYDVADVTTDKLMVTTLSLNASNRFNEFQSVSNPVTQKNLDEPSKLAGPKLRNTLEFLFRTPGLANPANERGLSQQSLDIMLNRAEAGTCAGCHQTSPRDGLTVRPAMVKIKVETKDGKTVETVVEWPDVAEGGFVHVREDRLLSPALEDHFLPVRRYLMGRFLCPAPKPGIAGASTITAEAIDSPEQAEPVDTAFVDDIIAAYVPEVMAGIAAFDTISEGGPIAILNGLPPTKQEEAVDAIRTEVAKAREAERSQPGALVDSRRPH